MSENKSFTLIVVPDRHAEVKRFRLEKRWVIQALAAVAVLVVIAGVLMVHYVTVVASARENPALREENCWSPISTPTTSAAASWA